MKTSILDPSNPISIINFLVTSKQACDSNGIHEGATVWLVKHFVNKSTVASLAPRVFLNSNLSCKREGMLSSWKEVVNHLLETYATDDVIVETKTDLQKSNQPLNK